MKKLVVFLTLIAIMMLAGCGVNKDYVAEQIGASEARTDAKVNAVSDKTDLNASELAKLQSLANAIDKKADMAISDAKGFENYQVIGTYEINFDYDSYELTGNAEATLMEAGQKLESSSGSIVEILGHTDKSGSSKYNVMLGQGRADAAKRFLAERFGMSLYRMFVISYGENKPKVMMDEVNAASTNRRVVLKVWGNL